LQLRRIEWTTAAVALVVGGAIPTGTLSGDAGRLLVTFLGLVSASILPTISLILASMTANGRSVQAVNDLQKELEAAMNVLFALFGLVGVSVAALILLSISTASLSELPVLGAVVARACQALVSAVSILIVMKSGQIPGILRRSLKIRHQIAVDEARRKTAESAPQPTDTSKSFATHPEFGRRVNLVDLRNEGDGR
jgi:hypothetical protein